MRIFFLAACAAACIFGAPEGASAQPINCSDPAAIASGLCQCVGTVDPRIAAIVAQFPAGGPGLRAAIARAVEADPGLADAAVAAARRANPDQKQAIGAGLADAANYFAKIGLDWARGAEGRIRTAMICADPGTRVGFQLGDLPTLVQGIPGFNNAGATTNACVNGRPISPSGAAAVPGC
jgi:hypothetical protein